jgi:hypothetical protein
MQCNLQPAVLVSFLFAIRRRQSRPKTSLRRRSAAGTRHAVSMGDTMKDLIFILITVGFFAGAWLYARSCEKL